MSIDHVLAQTWRDVVGFNSRLLGAGMALHENGREGTGFTWRKGKDLVTVRRTGGTWQVACLTQGRLLGPRLCVYQGIHKQAKYAAWDVMARVINASHDEEEGVQAAMDAARWMRTQEASGRASSDA